MDGQTLPKHYKDAHCVLKEFSTISLLKQFYVVAPGGSRLTASAFLLLCTIPFYSHHHEGHQ